MGAYCIRRENIEKLKKVFKDLDGQNKLAVLSDMSTEQRVKQFSKIMPEDEATLLSREFDLSIANEKGRNLVRFVRSNLDPVYREKRMTQAQKQSVRNFIESKVNNSKLPTEIIPINDLLKMSESERNGILSKVFGDDWVKIKKELDGAIDIKAGSTIKKLEESNIARQLREKTKVFDIQRGIIERYTKEKGIKITRKSVPMKDILRMKPDEQLAFLEKLMSKEDAIKTQNKINKESAGAIEKEVQERLKNLRENPNATLKNFDKFLKRKAEQISGIKAGTEIAPEEVSRIVELSKKVSDLKGKYNTDTNEWASINDKNAYGQAVRDLEKYSEELKYPEKTLKEELVAKKEAFKETYAEDKQSAIAQGASKLAKWASNLAISASATLDNSFFGRQGLHTLFTHPTVWIDGFAKSFSDIARTFKGEDVMDSVFVDAYSRKRFMSGEYDKAGIIVKAEEEIPTSILEKIPYLGKLIKASDVAFRGGSLKMRMNLYDKLADMAELNGLKLSDLNKTTLGTNEKKMIEKTIEDIGSLAGTLTGRAKLGKIGESAVTKLTLWAPRMLKANWNILTGHTAGFGMKTSFGKKQAGLNTLKVLASAAGIMGVANAVSPGSAETDPRSTNFGKIKIGDTTFDYTGGAGGIVTLASRIVTRKTKSGQTGVVTELGSKYGQSNPLDIIYDFLTNKFAPAPSAVADMLRGTNAIGEKVTPWNEIYSKMTPITLQNAFEGDGSPESIAGVLLDVFGINANTMKPRETNWNDSDGKELNNFKQSVSQGEFTNANNEFDELSSQYVKSLMKTESYKNADNEKKKSLITSEKEKAKKEIFEKYGFFTNAAPIDWNESDSKELQQFKDTKGEETFNKANQEYNEKVKTKIDGIKNDERFKKMSKEDKQKTITNAKAIIKDFVFKKYRFQYRESKIRKNPAISQLAK